MMNLLVLVDRYKLLNKEENNDLNRELLIRDKNYWKNNLPILLEERLLFLDLIIMQRNY